MNKRNYNESFYNQTFSEKEKKYKEKIEEQDNLNRWMFIIFFIIVAIMFGYIAKIKGDCFKLEYQIKQYKLFYEDISTSKEYKAIQKCKAEDFWKAECIAYELNDGK